MKIGYENCLQIALQPSDCSHENVQAQVQTEYLLDKIYTNTREYNLAVYPENDMTTA